METGQYGNGGEEEDELRGKLTVHFRSQSKLSQQELSDLQKATHFDKKELQQWYKGELVAKLARAAGIEHLLTKRQAS